MKITSDSEGGVCLHLSADEISVILKASKQAELFPDPKPISTNIYKHFRDNTINFIEELRSTYGNNWIDTSNDLFRSLRHRHHIEDPYQLIYLLEDRGGVVVEHVSRRHKRIKFQW
jgi:hypothetical protein